MSSNDLDKWVTSEVDFYALLGLESETFSESTLRRAYRKTALRYHPDKLGKDFDTAKYELFQAANEILGDTALKEKYDNTRNARLQKQRASELFEGRRRQMKEDLEARERGGTFIAGTKRPRDEERSEVMQEMRKLAEEGRKRRAARASLMAENIHADTPPSPAARPSQPYTTPAHKNERSSSPFKAFDTEDDIVERLEQKIREAEQARAQRKAEKKARKSGTFIPMDSISGEASVSKISPVEGDANTSMKRPDLFGGLKADEIPSATPLSSPRPPHTPSSTDFGATMARLKAVKEHRIGQEARQQQE